VTVDVGKAVIFTLNDGVDVQCGTEKNRGYTISVIIKITKAQFDKGLTIKKGHKLIDVKNKVIGVAVMDILGDMTNPYSYGPDTFVMEIFGFVNKNSVDIKSIPENVLNTFINSKTPLTLDAFKGFIKLNDYRTDDLLENYFPKLVAFSISESTVEDPSPSDRIRLIFENNKLLAVAHSRELIISGKKDYEIAAGKKIIVFSSPSGVSIQKFIAVNKLSYQGVD
jgi:hypothetical protein